MKISIKPVDLLFFGDSKPFERGIDRWAESTPFPNYSTIYGALRTTYFADHPEQILYANTEKDPTAGLKIKRIGYLLDNQIYYSAPADLVLDKNKEKKDVEEEEQFVSHEANCLKLQKLENQWNSLQSEENIEYFFTAPDGIKAVSLPNTAIGANKLLSEYAAGKNQVTLTDMNHFISYESKMGISINDSIRAVENGMLYRISQVKYKDLKILVEFENELCKNMIPSEGFLKLGGHGNVSCYSEYKEEEPVPKKINKTVKYIKIYLPAPAIFQNGWIPDFITDIAKKRGSLCLNGNKYTMKLLSACIRGSINVSGFDMKTKREKTMRRAVPAGSVYILELDEAYTMSSMLEEIWLESEQQKEGYGRAYVIGQEI